MSKRGNNDDNNERFKVPEPGPDSNYAPDPMRDRCAEAAARSGCREVLLCLQQRGVAITPGVPTVIQAAIASGFIAGWEVCLAELADAVGETSTGKVN